MTADLKNYSGDGRNARAVELLRKVSVAPVWIGTDGQEALAGGERVERHKDASRCSQCLCG